MSERSLSFEESTADWLIKKCGFAATDEVVRNVGRSRFSTIGLLLSHMASKTTVVTGLTAKEATNIKNIFRADQVKVFQQAQLLQLFLELEKANFLVSNNASVTTDKTFFVAANIRKELKWWNESSAKGSIGEISVEPLRLTEDNVLLVRNGLLQYFFSSVPHVMYHLVSDDILTLFPCEGHGYHQNAARIEVRGSSSRRRLP